MKFRATCLLGFLALALNAYAQVPNPPNFAVLAGTGITSADAGTTIAGNVGSCPNPAVTGLLAAQVTGGTLYADCSVSSPVPGAKAQLLTAYGVAAGDPCGSDLTGTDLGGLNLHGGGSLNVYCFSSSAGLTGNLTLTGGASDVFVFQIVSTLITGTNSTVTLDGVSPCNVFWQVGSSATIQTNNSFVGTIMALTSITLDGGTLNGRALARNGAVTISGQETIVNGCSGVGSGSGSTIVVSPVNSSIVCGSTGSSISKTALVLLNGLPVAGATVTFAVTAGPDLGRSGTATTDASGKATFTFTAPFSLASLAGDTIVATATINNATVTSNTTFATCSGSATSGCPNAPPPTVTVLAVTTGPPKQVIFSVQAPGGLFSVVVNTPPTSNATVVIPPFDIGTTLALGVTATKINQSKTAVVELTVTDQCGGFTRFDPVFATITIPEAKSLHHAAKFDFDHREVARFNGIGHTEGIVLLQNDTPGVESLVITVNGSQFRTRLSDGQTKKIDISSALFHGHNTVTVAASGDRGSSVDLTISDGK